MNELQQKIHPIIQQIDSLLEKARSGEIKPVQLGDMRISLLQQGLIALGDFYNFPAAVRYLASGEFTFYGNRGQHPESACAPFGDNLAAWLNTIPTRTGDTPSKGHVMSVNGWTRINHFATESLLRHILHTDDPT